MYSQSAITLRDIQGAQRLISPFVRQTPLKLNYTLSKRLGANVYLKFELFQKTGSFKVRGVFNKLLSLDRNETKQGIVALSGGNHAQAVAYAARMLQLRATVFLPEGTPQNYIEATRSYGADAIITQTIDVAFERVHEYERQGWIFIHPYDDPAVIAGQGTMGLEIANSVPKVTDVVISIGGGGMIGGVATAIKSINPTVRVWGVETEGADCMSQAVAADRVVKMPKITSIARTLGAPAASELTLEMAKTYLEEIIVVSDKEALDSLTYLLERAKVLTEPAGSCTLAAAERLKSRFKPEQHVVLILCGGNVGLNDLCRFDTVNRSKLDRTGSISN